MKCGFCNKEIEYNDLKYKGRKGRRVVMICPHCESILGVYYA
ncbi:MAG: hypothetical protein ACTSRI_21510 [Promethearchaeota archaeon]